MIEMMKSDRMSEYTVEILEQVRRHRLDSDRGFHNNEKKNIKPKVMRQNCRGETLLNF